MTNRKKASRYCIAYGCLNNDGNTQDITFFTLPKDIESRREWLILLDRENLLTKEDLRPESHVVCSAHFKDSFFKTLRKLKTGSVPMKVSRKPQDSHPAQICTDVQFKKLYVVSTQTDNLDRAEKSVQVSKAWADRHPTPGERVLKQKLWDSQNERQRLERELNKLQKQLEAKNSFVTEHTDDEIGKRFHKLIEWQYKLKSRSKGNRYDSEYKVFALNLYYASPRAYRSLRTILKLPSRSTIHRFKIDLPQKIDIRVIKSLEFKVKSLPDSAKYCVLCVHEMTLKNLQNDLKTEVNGTEEISPEIVNNAYTIMVQGINVKWKQPIAYTILAYTKQYEELDSWLTDVITKLSEIGIKVKAITTDQGSNFDKYAKDFKNVSVDKPYFMYNDKKIFYIFDVPNLIKCIRNNLITSDFYYDDKKISWDFIKQLYNYQKDKYSRLVPKLTESHMDPKNFKKMQVKYAVQVFSRTVSAAT